MNDTAPPDVPAHDAESEDDDAIDPAEITNGTLARIFH